MFVLSFFQNNVQEQTKQRKQAQVKWTSRTVSNVTKREQELSLNRQTTFGETKRQAGAELK